MKILRLPIKKKWFDMIASGEKQEEYREIKPYWDTRLCGHGYDAVQFRNGYSKQSRTVLVDLWAINIGFGLKEWGAPDCSVYKLILGPVLNKEGSK